MARPRSRTGISTTAQRELCWHLAIGETSAESARLAGFPDVRRLSDFQKTKEFAGELRQAINDRLSLSLAPKAVAALDSIVSDTKINPKIRVDAARVILDRAGHAAGDAAKAKPLGERGVEEYTIEELQKLVRDGEIRVQEEKAKRAAAALDVTPVNELAILE